MSYFILGKTGVASECIAYRAWQFSAEVRACVRVCVCAFVRTYVCTCVVHVSTPCNNLE